MREVLITVTVVLPLALDTFALATALGIAGLDARDRLRVSLVFTAFEAGMPVLGLAAGRAISGVFGAWAGYGGIAFLMVAGALLLRPLEDEGEDERRVKLLAHARGLAIIDLGLGISVDELTIGFSAGLLALPAALLVIWISVQAFAAAQIGLRFGSRIGDRLRERSEQLAGVALILVAVVLLVMKILGH